LRNIKLALCRMSEDTYSVVRGSLLLSCTLLLCAAMLLLKVGEVTVHNYQLYLCAMELIRAPAGLLLCTLVVSACIEDKVRM
jgi:hypothetical protein